VPLTYCMYFTPADNFFGISGPANLPKTVVDSIHKATMSALDAPELDNRSSRKSFRCDSPFSISASTMTCP